jgi:hypothetical protein
MSVISLSLEVQDDEAGGGSQRGKVKERARNEGQAPGARMVLQRVGGDT